jgi:hypothetical protein
MILLQLEYADKMKDKLAKVCGPPLSIVIYGGDVCCGLEYG